MIIESMVWWFGWSVVGGFDKAHLELDLKNWSTIWGYNFQRKLLQYMIDLLITNCNKILLQIATADLLKIGPLLL